MLLKQDVLVTEVAMFTDSDPSRQALVPAVWRALGDVAEFFTKAGVDGVLEIPVEGGAEPTLARIRPDFRQVWASRSSISPPASTSSIQLTEEFLADIFRRQIARGGPSSSGVQSFLSASSSIPASSAGTPRTVDGKLLGPALQKLIEPDGWMLLVTDLELTPPADWRYIIWEGLALGAVVSTAPLDPLYWREPFDSEQERARIVKHRARAACMSIVGSLVGLERCRNDQCFLYLNVDSVVRLDLMRYIGEEHGVPQLSFRGFVEGSEPALSGGVARLEESKT